MKKAFLPALIFALVTPSLSSNCSAVSAAASDMGYHEALQFAKDGVPVARASWASTARLVWDEPSGRFFIQHSHSPNSSSDYRPTQEDMRATDWIIFPVSAEQVGLKSFDPMTFAQALEAMREGQLLTRGSWPDGKVIWLNQNPCLYLQGIQGNRAATVQVLHLTEEDLSATDWLLAASDGDIISPPSLPFEMVTVPKQEFDILQWVLAGAFAIGHGYTAGVDASADPTGLLPRLQHVREEYERYLNQQQLEEINRERFENIGKVDGYYIDSLWAILANGIATEALACQREYEQKGTLRSDSFVVTIANNPNTNKVSFSSIFELAQRHGCVFDGVHDDYRCAEYSRSFRFRWLPKDPPDRGDDQEECEQDGEVSKSRACEPDVEKQESEVATAEGGQNEECPPEDPCFSYRRFTVRAPFGLWEYAIKDVPHLTESQAREVQRMLENLQDSLLCRADIQGDGNGNLIWTCAADFGRWQHPIKGNFTLEQIRAIEDLMLKFQDYLRQKAGTLKTTA